MEFASAPEKRITSRGIRIGIEHRFFGRSGEILKWIGVEVSWWKDAWWIYVLRNQVPPSQKLPWTVTIGWGFVTWHHDETNVELAGGEHYNTASLRAKVAEIQSKIPAGMLPVEGFCVAAGIPSTKKAAGIIDGLSVRDPSGRGHCR